LIAFGFPLCGVVVAAKNIIQFHNIIFYNTEIQRHRVLMFIHLEFLI
jgi:hypothetical protein